MTIRILKPPPATPKYVGTCTTCRCEVEFDAVDSAASPDPREGNQDIRFIDCPVPTCHGQAFGTATRTTRTAP